MILQGILYFCSKNRYKYIAIIIPIILTNRAIGDIINIPNKKIGKEHSDVNREK